MFLKSITPQKKKSKIMESAIDSLNKRRRETSQSLIDSIKEAKEKNAEAKKKIKEINKELSEVEEQFKKAKSDFLELSDEDQLDRAVEIQQLENRIGSLTRNRNSLSGIIPSNEKHIEEWLKRLDKLRKEEFEARQKLALKQEAKIAQSQGHDAVVKLIQRRFLQPLEELDKLTVEEAKEDEEWLAKTEKFFKTYGLPFPNKVVDVFPGSETKDFPEDLFESVRGKLNAVKAIQRR